MMFDNMLEPSNDKEIVRKGRSVAALHEYLRSTSYRVNVAAKLLSDLHSTRGTGKIFVHESNSTLYYYSGNKIYHIFSRGGRFILIIARPTLSWTADRQKVIQKRFLQVDGSVDQHLVDHFEKLLKLSGSKNFGAMTQQFINGEFRVHMRDFRTPFVEVGLDRHDNPLVIPLQLITELSAANVLPHTTIKYMGQCIVLASNEDYTIRVLYASHLLEDKLFTQHGQLT